MTDSKVKPKLFFSRDLFLKPLTFNDRFNEYFMKYEYSNYFLFLLQKRLSVNNFTLFSGLIKMSPMMVSGKLLMPMPTATSSSSRTVGLAMLFSKFTETPRSDQWLW